MVELTLELYFSVLVVDEDAEWPVEVLRGERVVDKEEEVERQEISRQGRLLGEAEGIAAYNRVDTPFAGEKPNIQVHTFLESAKLFS